MLWVEAGECDSAMAMADHESLEGVPAGIAGCAAQLRRSSACHPTSSLSWVAGGESAVEVLLHESTGSRP